MLISVEKQDQKDLKYLLILQYVVDTQVIVRFKCQIMNNRDMFAETKVPTINDLGHDTTTYKTEVEGRVLKILDLLIRLQKQLKEYIQVDPETGKYALEVNEGEKFTGDSVEYNSLADAVKD
ncbi:MAG: hypothetical protein CM15mV25_0660 [uncultured marine virus]|nr:MAG: hypothetical protein CM15mV25_0660 [uncultured marine virus]